MRVWHRIRQQLRAIFLRRRMHAELREEMDAFVEMLRQEALDEGLSPSQAYRQARLRAGSLESAKAQVRETWAWASLDQLLQDLRYGLRTLANSPLYAAVAVLTLALGIGPNVLIFSLVEGTLLRPLPYPGSERLVELWNTWAGEPRGHLAVPEFLAYQRETSTLAALAAVATDSLNLTGGDEPERVTAAFASSKIFDVLGVEPVLGRGFTATDDRPGADPVAVISHELFDRRFGADESVVGRALRLDGLEVTVVGVAPPGLRLPSDHRDGSRTDLWLPLRPAMPPGAEEEWGMHFLAALGRLRSGVELAAARAELDLVVERIKESGVAGDDAASKPSFGALLLPARDEVVGPVRPALQILLAAVALVLAIAGANVAGLQLARARTRRSEIALRATLGASRGRLLRQLLTESAVLGAAGGGVGLVLAVLGLRGVLAIAPAGIPRLEEVRLDAGLFAFTAAVSLLAGLIFGSAPALRAAGRDVAPSLSSTGRGSEAASSGRWRHGLVATEVGLAVVLVLSAGLLVKTFWRLQRVDPGYLTEGVLTMRVDLSETAYGNVIQANDFFRRLRERVSALPGVEAVGGVSHLPLATRRGDWNFYYEERTLAPDVPKPRGDWQVVTPGYFEAMGVAIQEGRGLDHGDAADGDLVLLVNGALAQRYWPDSSPLGRRIRLGGRDDNPFATIVGVVEDIRHASLDQGPVPELYIPFAQAERIMGRGFLRGLSLTIRTRGEPERLVGPVRRQVQVLDPDLPVSDVRTMAQIRVRSLAVSRLATVLLSSFSALALLLGAVGVFGLLTYLVVHRRREIAIRMAIGARRMAIVRDVLRQGLSSAVIGLALGVLAALALTRVLSSLLYEVSPTDPATWVAVGGLFVAVVTLAAYLPARRAAATDPMRALREE